MSGASLSGVSRRFGPDWLWTLISGNRPHHAAIDSQCVKVMASGKKRNAINELSPFG